jgi:hypothetical protein
MPFQFGTNWSRFSDASVNVIKRRDRACQSIPPDRHERNVIPSVCGYPLCRPDIQCQLPTLTLHSIGVSGPHTPMRGVNVDRATRYCVYPTPIVTEAARKYERVESFVIQHC